MTFNEKMTALADSIRILNGTSGALTLDAMTTNVSDANTEINNAFTALAEKGVVIPDGAKIGDLAGLVTTIEGGGDTTLPTLDNPAASADILSGKQAINGDGLVMIGAIPTKTSNDISATDYTVQIPAGYYANSASKDVNVATQATPEIFINSDGLITASAVQSSGYVVGGTKTSTMQLAFQPAKTITPAATSQTAVSSGYYTGGTVTVAGDSNLIAENIKDGVSIFGITGNYEGSGSTGGDTSVEDALIEGTLTEYTNDRATTVAGNIFANMTTVSFPACETIGSYAFQNCSSLTSVDFPACISIGGSAFYSCSSLTTANFPACISIDKSAFYTCTNLTSINFPVCTTIGINALYSCAFTSVYFQSCATIETGAFAMCKKLTSANFPVCTTIGANAFQFCIKLATVSFPVCTKIGNSTFQNCSSLTSVDFPACISIGASAFASCSSLTSVDFPACTSIGVSAFYSCIKLATVNFPVCTTIGSAAFYICRSLASVNFPACISIYASAFLTCSKLATVSFPACETIGNKAFQNCSSLTSVDFPACISIGASAFATCTTLSTLILRHSSVCVLSNSNAFTSTPIKSGTGYIYVPASLVDAYKTATNWTYFSSRISAIEDMA